MAIMAIFTDTSSLLTAFPAPRRVGQTLRRGAIMPGIVVTNTRNETRTIEAEAGRSVMEALRLAGCDDILALCGGCLSCATCHVLIAPQDFARVGPPSAAETDLLESSKSHGPTSRLSCQITLTAALDGLHLTIAPED